MHRAQQFATLAGVTVRTLHHYDRLGLLRPRRSESGYRLYRESDIERLEQIVALKFLGLPLKEIKALLDSEALDLPAALRMQRRALERKRRMIDCAIAAIRDAETVAASGQTPGAALKKIIEVIEMQNETEWSKKYYDEAAQQRIKERQKLWSPELQERVGKQWMELIADVKAAIAAGEDPAGPKAEALRARWKELVGGFTGGDPGIVRGLRNMYADRENWPHSAKERMKASDLTPEVWRFIAGGDDPCRS
jgi:DNA-binding transcriptional MerR regulator